MVKEYIYTTIINNALEKGVLKFAKSFTISSKKMTISFKDYNTYAYPLKELEDDYANNLVEDLSLLYFEMTDNETNYKESFWAMNAMTIPDFFWIPRKKSKKNNRSTEILDDLWNIIGACRLF